MTAYNNRNNDPNGDDSFYFAARISDDPRDAGTWYAWSTIEPDPTYSAENFNFRYTLFDPTAANWTELDVDQGGGTVSFVGPAGADVGHLLTGVGILASINNAASDFSSSNFADYRLLTFVPEPASMLLLVMAGSSLLLFRRRWN